MLVFVLLILGEHGDRGCRQADTILIEIDELDG